MLTTLFYSVIPAVNVQVFNSTAEIVIPTGTPMNKANAEIEISKLKPCILFYVFHSLNHVLFFLKNVIVSSIFFRRKSRPPFSFSIFLFKVLIYHFVIFFIVVKIK